MSDLPAPIRELIETLDRIAASADDDVHARVGAVRPALEAALVDSATRDLYAGRERSFLVWSAPGSLALHASVHRPGHVTPPHDHGISWAVYGVVSGPTTFSRLMRGSDRAPGQATLRSRMDIELPPGATEVVWPGQVHAVANRGDGWGWNLVVRSRLLNEISRTTFDEATGAYQIQTPSAR